MKSASTTWLTWITVPYIEGIIASNNLEQCVYTCLRKASNNLEQCVYTCLRKVYIFNSFALCTLSFFSKH